VLSAAFGVGGAVVSTPGIRVLGASAFVAVGTTLPSILPSAASGVGRYARERLIRWDVVAWVAPAGVAASVAGSVLSHAVPGHGHWLMIATALLLAVTAVRMGRVRPATRNRRWAPADQGEGSLQPITAAAIGVASGLLSGLLGVGGGIVMVPAFSEVLGLPTKVVVATSLACVGIFALPGTFTHALLGDIDWRFALLLAVAVVPGARLGAALAIRAADHRLRVAVAGFLGAISVVYAAGEVLALAR
jgi:uncharacterized membrane protein YfcA